MPERIRLSRRKGWRMPPDTVKVDRSTIYGNPFKAGEGLIRNATDAVNAFRAVLEGHHWSRLNFGHQDLIRLRGKNLACWCKPGEPCHADVLLEAANQPVRLVA